MAHFRFLMAAAVLMLAACYNDFDDPAPAYVYTDSDLVAEGFSYISIADLKARFHRENPSAGAGAVASWTIAEPLYTRGKVISSDRAGNIYKSLYIYDGESRSAIELKLTSGNYLFYPAGYELFVRLDGLTVGNYRGMLSIGVASGDAAYSNDNIETTVMLEEHVLRGANRGMSVADTLVVTPANYTSLSDDDLGRLVRFEDIESRFGQAPWGYRNRFPNYFAGGESFDSTSAGWEDIDEWATWAAFRRVPVVDGEGFTDTYYYGSAWFTYLPAGSQSTSVEGNYVVRTSGYSSFRDGRIPVSGTRVDLTAIYTKYTNSSGRNVTYQLILNRETDVVPGR